MRIESTLARLRDEGRRALVPFVTAGDPSLAATGELVRAVEGAGADLVELGVPFSDPLADGPTIQASSQRALAAGTTLRGILDQVEKIRPKVNLPIVLMGYANPVRALGAERFARRAAGAGVDGLIVPDLPPEEGAEIFEPLREQGVDPILLVAPTTPDDRVARIGRESRGFVYYVSLTGVTGERAAPPPRSREADPERPDPGLAARPGGLRDLATGAGGGGGAPRRRGGRRVGGRPARSRQGRRSRGRAGGWSPSWRS